MNYHEPLQRLPLKNSTWYIFLLTEFSEMPLHNMQHQATECIIMVQQTVKHNRLTDRSMCQTEMSVTCKSEFQTDKNTPTFKKVFFF